MRSLIRAVYRFRDATLVAEKKDDFGSALQNLYAGAGASGGSSCTVLIVPDSFRSFGLKNPHDSFCRYVADHDFVQAMGGQID
ncbi:MAG TPA: hypothetical protein VN857_08965 [Chthoniobacterales bacterium]|jgi:hypothetical protein|nr:hypothetical protein [Chthoniobacterales bacterium]